MESATSIRFTDLRTSNEFWAGVRYGHLGIGFTVVNNWKQVGPAERKEIEIIMKPEDARAVLKALGTAIEIKPPVMSEVAAITFADADTGEATSIIVRHDAASVDFILCNEDDGEVRIAMKRKDARSLLGAMKIAVERGSVGKLQR